MSKVLDLSVNDKGKIPDHWEIKKVKDVSVINELSINNKFASEIIEYIDIASVENREIKEIQKLRLSEAPSRAKRIVRNEDILISSVRPNLKHFTFIKNAKHNTIASTGFVVITAKRIDPQYLYYFLTTDDYTEYLTQIAEGHTSAYPSFNPDIIENSDILIPPQKEQKAIARILSSLDDKIELNNQMNKNLEEIGQTFFKHWFIDFEFPDGEGNPYKSSGGKMVESEFGLIPEGWEVGKINDMVLETMGGDWGKDINQGSYNCKVYCVRGTDVPELEIGNTGKMPSRFILKKNCEPKILQVSDIVIETSGGSPTQSTGRAIYISDEMLSRFDKPLVCSNFCRRIRLIDQNYSEFLYMYLRYLYKIDILFQFENGTTGIKNLDITSLFDTYKVIIPEKNIVKHFRGIIKVFLKKIQENGRLSQFLNSIRDTLLPKLMSGELKVKDIC